MVKIFHPLLALIASSANDELAKYIQYLKEENKILRSRLPKQLHTNPEERATLLKFGKLVGKAIKELITIVSPETFARWVRNEGKGPKARQRNRMNVQLLYSSRVKSIARNETIFTVIIERRTISTIRGNIHAFRLGSNL